MKRTVTLIAICLLLGIVATARSPDAVLWYDHPASDWNEALPVGNGRLGAMMYGDFNNETIQLNEESLWGGSKSEADADAREYIPKIQQLLLDGRITEAAELSEKHLRSVPMSIRSFQTFGDLKIDFSDNSRSKVKVEDYRRELDLSTGIASVTYSLNGVRYRRELFASADADVIALKLTSDTPGSLTFRLQYTRKQDAYACPLSDTELGIIGQIIDLPKKDVGEPGLHMRFAGHIRGVHKGGKMQTAANAFYVENADEAIFYFTAATDYDFSRLDWNRDIDPSQKCLDIQKKINGKPYEAIKEEHIAEHSAMFDRVSFNMGSPVAAPTDERLRRLQDGEQDLSLVTLYFQYGRYLLMNSSRFPGILPANLQGIWNKDIYAPWSSDFHTNINIQMNYWPAEVCNLSETVVPFSDLINALRVPGRVTARKSYNSEGWTMNHLTDPFGRTAIADGVGWGAFPIAGAWLVLHQWEHYLFTVDMKYLEEEAYPAMKEAAKFILGFLVEDRNGYLVTAPSTSPENKYRLPDGTVHDLTYGATMDIEIISELLNACIEAGKITGSRDSRFDRELKTTLKRLPPIRIGENGTIQEWIEDYEEVEPGHRHISHLFGLYPGKTISSKQKDLFDAARKTIERRRNYNENAEHINGSYTGWSRAWMINFYARLMDGDEAGRNVGLLLSKNTLTNLFNTHPPFQIDGNFGGTAGIAEMLLQSHTGEIHLLPALPSSWSDGEISGLCARGAVTVNMKWSDGTLQSAGLYSATRQKVKVRYKDTCRTVTLEKGMNHLDTSLNILR